MSQENSFIEESREIFLIGDINYETLKEFAISLKTLEAKEFAPIKIYLSTEGGDIHAGIGIFDLIRTCSCITTTICTGTAQSAGFIILQASSSRLAYKNSIIMNHDISVEGNMRKKDLEAYFNKYKELKKALDDFIINRMVNSSGITKIKARKILSNYSQGDHYLTTEEATTYGILDGTI